MVMPVLQSCMLSTFDHRHNHGNFYVCHWFIWQDSLLHHLGVSLNATDGWPLRIRPRTLAVLTEVILLRQQNEKDSQTAKKNSETVIMNIWSQFIATLVGIIENFDNNVADFEGLLSFCCLLALKWLKWIQNEGCIYWQVRWWEIYLYFKQLKVHFV